MKVLVIKTFVDIHTGAISIPGDELTITKERCSEINATSLFVEEIKKPKK